MDARRNHSSTLRRVAVTGALAALLVPAGVAEAAKKSKKVRLPKVTKVVPMDASVGEELTIYGKRFKRGMGKNQVAFKRKGTRALFVRADVSTKRKMKVVLPKKLEDLMVSEGGVLQPTQFRIRVLAKRFGKRFTGRRKSPTIGAEKPPETVAPAPAVDDGDCDGDKILNRDDPDDDDDLLSDDLEKQIKTDPCKRDTDGDGVEDGYEYQSALDLNRGSQTQSVPYPHKTPYPNPLNADETRDYDGDGLWLIDEYRLWKAHGEHSLTNLLYSDGKQKSRDVNTVGYEKQALFLSRAASAGFSEMDLLNFNGTPVPGLSGGDDYDAWWAAGSDDHFKTDNVINDVERYYYDLDYDGKLSDDERDEDGDGLSNWQEAHGFATPEWWTRVYSKEKPFVNPFKGTDLTDWDSDGDGVVDGADDQDFDDLPNVREIRRQLVAGETPDGVDNYCRAAYTTFVMGNDPWTICWNRRQEGTGEDPWAFNPMHGWVQPFNPCLPNPRSRTCERYPNLGALYPPFDENTPTYNVFDGHLWNAE